MEQKLKVLLTISQNYKEFCDQMYQLSSDFINQNKSKYPRRNVLHFPLRKSDRFCKFDLFTDEQIGLKNIEDVALSQEALVHADQDEDYSTDCEVMRNTKRLCFRDFKETWRQIVSDQHYTERHTHNYKYQVQFGKFPEPSSSQDELTE